MIVVPESERWIKTKGKERRNVKRVSELASKNSFTQTLGTNKSLPILPREHIHKDNKIRKKKLRSKKNLFSVILKTFFFFVPSLVAYFSFSFNFNPLLSASNEIKIKIIEIDSGDLSGLMVFDSSSDAMSNLSRSSTLHVRVVAGATYARASWIWIRFNIHTLKFIFLSHSNAPRNDTF